MSVAIFPSVVLFIIGRAILGHFTHKSKRRDYEHERSSKVNFNRYEAELSFAEKLSDLFMQLRIQTHDLLANNKSALEESLAKWDALYNEAYILLGKSASAFNIISTFTGKPPAGSMLGHQRESFSMAPLMLAMKHAVRRFTHSQSTNKERYSYSHGLRSGMGMSLPSS